MPHFHNLVQFRRSPGSLTAAGTLQSPGAAPNSAVFRGDRIKPPSMATFALTPFYVCKDFTHKLYSGDLALDFLTWV